MLKNRYWLVDATYDDGIVQLTYIRSPDGTLEVFQHEYTPYFYALPLSTGEPVSRQELLSGQQIKVAKVPSTTTVRVSKEWERGLNPALSYVCDNKLRFGSPHRRTNELMQLDLTVSEGQQRVFTTHFGEVAQQDPLKYNFLNEFFQLTIQPVPEIPSKRLKIKSKDGKTKLYEGMMLARIANLPLKRVLGSRRVSEWIRTMLHTTYRHLGILIPDPEELKKGYKPHRVEGALTLAPTPGAYFNMTVLDFESLYPSCIDYYNLSYETVDCGHVRCQQVKVPGTEHYVCTQRRGIFSALIGALKDLRIHWFKPRVRQTDINPEDQNRAKVMSDLLKLFLVSCFGVTIRIPGLACPPLAESITAYGRWALQTSWNLAKEYGIRPVYGDTDSLFLDNPTQQQIEWLIGKTKDDLGLTLSVDVVYPLCVLSSAKKAYFGMLADGTPDIKGITLGKSSTPPLFRGIFLEVVSPLVGVDTPEKLTERAPQVVEILRKRLKALRQGDFSIRDMEYRVITWKKMEGRDQKRGLAQPYQALQQLADRGISVTRREEVAFVKVKPFRYGKRTFTVKPTQLAAKDEIDIPDYVRKLELAFQQVLEPLGIQFPEASMVGLDAYLPPPSERLDEDQEQIRKPKETESKRRREPQRRLIDFD